MVEGARLESVCTVILYREFESLTLRHFFYFLEKSFLGRAAVFGACAMESLESCQVRKEAAIRGSFHVPQGYLKTVVRRGKEQQPLWLLFLYG